MVFTSAIFLYAFLPTTLLVYYLLPRKFQNAFLLLASYVFYAWSVPKYLVLILISTLIDYVCVLWMVRTSKPTKIPLFLSICCNLGLLGFFKYYGFFLENVNPILKSLDLGGLPVWNLVLPVGISFYTFQSMSYTIDVYRGRVKPTSHWIDFACFVALFPQLVAGPIVRYVDIAQQLRERKPDLSVFTVGTWFFMMGFSKKVLLANQVGILADKAFALAQPQLLDSWVGLLGYTMQIYFDFSGYSDMAIGLGLMFGFRFPFNFDSPYQAQSITDFWRRWHMTLSTWFREFVYIPLGGNRHSQGRTMFNLVATFFLSGLWHGASWNFVIWGLYHGTFLLLERAFRHRGGLWERLPRWPRQLLILVIVMLGWVVFRAPDINQALNYYQGLLGLHGYGPLTLIAFWHDHAPLFFLPLATLIALLGRNSNHLSETIRPRSMWWVFLLFLLACIELSNQGYNPFLYFQF